MKKLLIILPFLISCSPQKVVIKGQCEPIIKDKQFIVYQEYRIKSKIPLVKKSLYYLYDDQFFINGQYQITMWRNRYNVGDTLITKDVKDTDYYIKLEKK